MHQKEMQPPKAATNKTCVFYVGSQGIIKARWIIILEVNILGYMT